MKNTLGGSKSRTYMKIIVDKATDKVVGMHMVGEDAGEIIQGFAAALKAGITKKLLDSTLGIHPTAAEEFVTMREAAR
jgi:glutathione reductase (NADPH)